MKKPKAPYNTKWTKSIDGWCNDAGWKIRQVNGYNGTRATKLYWVYTPEHVRFTPTGHYDDAVSFQCVRSAKKYIEFILANPKLMHVKTGR